MPNAANYLLIKETLDVAVHIMRWLGVPGMVGLAMMEAHYEGSPWRTAKQLAARGECSEDTARRKADDLVSCRRAMRETRGGSHYYAICPKVAQTVIARMQAFELVGEPQVAAGTCREGATG